MEGPLILRFQSRTIQDNILNDPLWTDLVQTGLFLFCAITEYDEGGGGSPWQLNRVAHAFFNLTLGLHGVRLPFCFYAQLGQYISEKIYIFLFAFYLFLQCQNELFKNAASV